MPAINISSAIPLPDRAGGECGAEYENPSRWEGQAIELGLGKSLFCYGFIGMNTVEIRIDLQLQRSPCEI
jgi:hypothetical protein